MSYSRLSSKKSKSSERDITTGSRYPVRISFIIFLLVLSILIIIPSYSAIGREVKGSIYGPQSNRVLAKKTYIVLVKYKLGHDLNPVTGSIKPYIKVNLVGEDDEDVGGEIKKVKSDFFNEEKLTSHSGAWSGKEKIEEKQQKYLYLWIETKNASSLNLRVEQTKIEEDGSVVENWDQKWERKKSWRIISGAEIDKGKTPIFYSNLAETKAEVLSGYIMALQSTLKDDMRSTQDILAKAYTGAVSVTWDVYAGSLASSSISLAVAATGYPLLGQIVGQAADVLWGNFSKSGDYGMLSSMLISPQAAVDFVMNAPNRAKLKEAIRQLKSLRAIYREEAKLWQRKNYEQLKTVLNDEKDLIWFGLDLGRFKNRYSEYIDWKWPVGGVYGGDDLDLMESTGELIWASSLIDLTMEIQSFTYNDYQSQVDTRKYQIKDLDGDGERNWQDADDDGDSYPDAEEIKEGTDFSDPDSNPASPGNDSIPPDTTIEEAPSAGSILETEEVSFRWSGSDDETADSNLLYQFKLEGHDDSWSKWAQKTTKTYTGLDNGQYTFYVRVKDKAGNIESDSSIRKFSIKDSPFPPSLKVPNNLTGSNKGLVAVPYSLSAQTEDPNGDEIYYVFKWGDGNTSRVPSTDIGTVNSGTEVDTPHVWAEPGSYQVKVKAMDTKDNSSTWSAKEVNIEPSDTSENNYAGTKFGSDLDKLESEGKISWTLGKYKLVITSAGQCSGSEEGDCVVADIYKDSEKIKDDAWLVKGYRYSYDDDNLVIFPSHIAVPHWAVIYLLTRTDPSVIGLKPNTLPLKQGENGNLTIDWPEGENSLQKMYAFGEGRKWICEGGQEWIEDIDTEYGGKATKVNGDPDLLSGEVKLPLCIPEDATTGTHELHLYIGDSWNSAAYHVRGVEVDVIKGVIGNLNSSFSEGWNLFSAPGIPQNKDPEKSLGDDIGEFQLYYDYSPGKGYKNYPDDTDQTKLTWGEGYWTRISEKTDIEMEVEVPNQSHTLEFKEEGWQIFGVPYQVRWDEISVKNPQNFETDGAGNVRLVSWDPTKELYLNHYSDTSYVLDPWRGYWIKVKQASTSDPATITVTETNQSPTATGTRTPLPQSVERDQLDYPPLPQKIADNFQAFAYPNPVTKKDQVTFAAQMAEVEKIKVTITNMAGELVYDSEYESGNKLNWNLNNTSGNKVANGIYLYKIQATGADGTTQASEVKRLLMLR